MKQQLAWILGLFLCAVAGPALGQTVGLQFDPSNPQASYAACRLAAALKERNHEIARNARDGAFTVTLSVDAKSLQPEAFATNPGRRSLAITGGDGRGVIYGALSVAEQLRTGTALRQVRAMRESAALPFRAIKFNLPWDSYRSSSALDLHYDTVRDPKY